MRRVPHRIARIGAIVTLVGSAAGAAAVSIDRPATVGTTAVRSSDGSDRRTLVLTATGFGGATIGATAADTLDRLGGHIGPATQFTRRTLVDATFRGCLGGDEVLIIGWDSIRFWFVRSDGVADEDATLFNFTVSASEVAGSPVSTDQGASVGDSLGRWRELHPDARYSPGEPDFSQPTLELTDGLLGLIDVETQTISAATPIPPWFCE